MLKKYKMLIEVVAKKETENWAIGLRESGLFMKDIAKVTTKHKFDCYIKWYPKDKLEYEPTNKTFEIKTVEDIAELDEKQFEFFIDDLRQWCNLHRQIKVANDLVWADIIQGPQGITWLDTWLNETKINFTTTNKM